MRDRGLRQLDALFDVAGTESGFPHHRSCDGARLLERVEYSAAGGIRDGVEREVERRCCHGDYE